MKSTLPLAVAFAALSLLFAADGAGARESARIMALGGSAVSGVIPDHYTDLYLNPIYALEADTLTLWYTRRSDPSLEFVSGLPRANVTGFSGSYEAPYNPSNEAALHGLRLGQWRLALMSRWSFNKTHIDDSESALYLRSNNEVRFRIIHRDADAEAWMLDLAAARPAGGERTLGLRVRARGFYNNYTDVQGIHYYTYNDWQFNAPSRYSKYENGRNHISRRIGFDIQGALGRKRNGLPHDEISVTVSLHRLSRKFQGTSIDLLQRFDSHGATEYYGHALLAGNVSREGDLRSAGTAYRRLLPGGVRLYVEGSLAILSYDAASGINSDYYSADLHSLSQKLYSAYTWGEGSVVRGDVSASAGRVFALHRTLDLYVTAGGGFFRSVCEEDPFTRYTYSETGAALFDIELPVSYSFTESGASFVVPLSLEFRPASWFSYFAAFVPHARFARTISASPIFSPFVLFPPASARAAGGQEASMLASDPLDDPLATIETRQETYETSHSFTCGLSLRLREQIAVDVYTKSSPIPYNWHDLVMNIRCGF